MIIRFLLSPAFLLSLLLTTTNLLRTTQAKKDEPRIVSTEFEHPLQTVFYFDDSNIILGHDRESDSVWRTTDAGEHWTKLTDDYPDMKAWDLWQHPFDKTRAYILGFDHNHWMTKDRGETWKKFETDATPTMFTLPFSFHGRDPKKVIWHARLLSGGEFEDVAYYTEDDFETLHELKSGNRGCRWAVSSPTFGEEIEPFIDDRIFCVVRGLYSPWTKDNRLVVSDNHFETEFEPELDNGRTVTGVISMAPVKKFMVAAAKAEGTDELALYVTVDSVGWHRAQFGKQRVDEEAYTILESTNYSIQVDVMNTNRQNPMGILFSSNSNGTYFTANIEHTNRNTVGNVDFEKIQGIQGLVLVNTVSNWAEVETGYNIAKEVVTSMSFDDGRTFHELKVGKDRLHLHSVTDLANAGRVFSSPAPGIVMGIGNTGKSLRSRKEGDLYISDDAGLTWRLALEGSHKYEFGNQGAIIVAIVDREPTSEIKYSINHGKDWLTTDLGFTIDAKLLTTVPDSTTLKFLLEASSGKGSKTTWQVVMIDFDGLHERSCGKDDFEDWVARKDENGKPSCIMGHKQTYTRRKADADCFIEGEFKDPEPKFERCSCTKEDFECDFNFIRNDDRSECIPADIITPPEGQCKNPDNTFMGSSGWRLIPGDECDRDGGIELDKEVERACKDSVKKPASGQVTVEKTYFAAKTFNEWHYLERTHNSIGDDETIIMRTGEQEIYLSRDHGKSWLPILEGKPVTSITPHPYFNDVVYFLTDSDLIYYSIDRAKNIHEFFAPTWPNKQDLPKLRFHPVYKDWLLWAGSQCEGSDCHTDVHYSKDRGDDWNTLLRYVRKCEFIRKKDVAANEQMIFCEQYQNEDKTNPLQLVSSENWFADNTVHFPDILAFATMAEFIIVAAKTPDRKSLKVDASVDGYTFAAAEFPHAVDIPDQQAYTVLDSSTHAVFLHVTINNNRDHEYGSIIKSNSNGTSYVLTLRYVNRDTEGYVDFEKMQGLEGVALVNVVANPEDVDAGQKKKLKSMITHNDGAEWALIPPPAKDVNGRKFDCEVKERKATDDCSLHIHSYTERFDKSATFSSSSSIGVMMAVGNVGEFLKPKDDESTDTFITGDGGITWASVKKGSYMWEYGDQGSIIVIVEESKPTKVIFYTLDEGLTWIEKEFSSVLMQIDAISSLPSDNSFNFLLWGREIGEGAKTGIVTVNLDFSALTERQRPCHLSETVTTNEDYFFWSPRHPLQEDDCLFGHVAQYHRKKPEAQCYNGREIQHLHSYLRNCSCTRQDFECDYNFERKADGSCELVEGLTPSDHSAVCVKDPSLIEYFEPTGYRRIPLTTCQEGRELDKIVAKPCPGHKDEFEQKHGISGIGLFFAIIIPITLAAGIGYYVWRNWHEKFYGFGQIRLGESIGGDGGWMSGRSAGGESLFITIPVAIIAGTWAVTKAIPLLVSSLWRSVRGYMPIRSTSAPYTSRGAFSARRQDYSHVVADEDELLGDDLEDGEDV